ncbi:V-type sodium ATPase subunit G [bioreactor metagenome]|uniref:V-type sodium ATPase subunit G n=1 Tax=bioreactor metagenome TaxID=1076179 RepID=A0A645CLA7_9ZZZZ|nr:V-type ATP synthase subunit F [Christensenella sp.]
MAKIGVIGDRDSVLLFKAVGLDVYFEDDGARANRTLHRLAREGYAAVFVTEKLFSACAETIAEFQGQPYPAIIPIPDNQGSLGIGEKTLRQNVEKAVGMDILANS